MDFSLIIPAFFAGIITFLAPCTLPLIPGYLGFISGVSSVDLEDPEKSASWRKKIRGKVFLNGLFYVVGFSAVFIILGSLLGLGGQVLGQYRIWLSRVGGVFVIIFGLYMLGVLKLNFLSAEKTFNVSKFLRPGNPASSFIFGSAFAFGWTPCVGPVLGAILTLAASSATVAQGAFLLAVFSLGLAVPFLLIALGIERASRGIAVIAKYLKPISIIGGVFLIVLGFLLVTDMFSLWLTYAYKIFDFIQYEALLDYL